MTRKNTFAIPYPAREPVALQLPLWPEPKRGAPNTFLRSALFTATQGRDRRWLHGETIASLSNFALEFTGQQLTQSDLDVWEAIVHLARFESLGTECRLTARAILRTLGRDNGKSQRVWLNDVIMRLSTCTIRIRQKGSTFFGHLIDSGLTVGFESSYSLRLNADMLKLFGFDQWTQLDWTERLRMLKQPLAQWLHGYWSTHASPMPIGVDTLLRLSGSNARHARNFKIHLRGALDTLVQVGFLKAFELEGDTVRVTRTRAPRLGNEASK